MLAVPLSPPCAEDITWRWVAVVVLLLAVTLFWLAVSTLHELLAQDAIRVKWQEDDA